MNQLSVRESKSELASLDQFSLEQVDLIKQTVCKGASDAELQFFLCVCMRTGLDPFMKQIYSIPRSGQRTIQVSIDGSRSIADKTNKYMPGRKPTFSYNPKGELFSATSYVKKMASDGSWHEIEAEALWTEYNPGNNPIWKKMPHTMLAKCAEALALRKAFPSHLSGIYTNEEMHQAEAPQNLKSDTLYQEMVEYINADQVYEINTCLGMLDKTINENFMLHIQKKYKAETVSAIQKKDFGNLLSILKMRLENMRKEKLRQEEIENTVDVEDENTEEVG